MSEAQTESLWSRLQVWGLPWACPSLFSLVCVEQARTHTSVCIRESRQKRPPVSTGLGPAGTHAPSVGDYTSTVIWCKSMSLL